MNAQVCVCRPKEEGWCVCVCVGWHTHTLSVWSQAISGFCCLYCLCLTLDCMMCYRPITETHWGQTRQSLTSPVLFFTRTNKTFFFLNQGWIKKCLTNGSLESSFTSPLFFSHPPLLPEAVEQRLFFSLSVFYRSLILSLWSLFVVWKKSVFLSEMPSVLKWADKCLIIAKWVDLLRCEKYTSLPVDPSVCVRQLCCRVGCVLNCPVPAVPDEITVPSLTPFVLDYVTV